MQVGTKVEHRQVSCRKINLVTSIKQSFCDFPYGELNGKPKVDTPVLSSESSLRRNMFGRHSIKQYMHDGRMVNKVEIPNAACALWCEFRKNKCYI